MKKKDKVLARGFLGSLIGVFVGHAVIHILDMVIERLKQEVPAEYVDDDEEDCYEGFCSGDCESCGVCHVDVYCCMADDPDESEDDSDEEEEDEDSSDEDDKD